jgi:hypothetical protein
VTPILGRPTRIRRKDKQGGVFILAVLARPARCIVKNALEVNSVARQVPTGGGRPFGQAELRLMSAALLVYRGVNSLGI